MASDAALVLSSGNTLAGHLLDLPPPPTPPTEATTSPEESPREGRTTGALPQLKGLSNDASTSASASAPSGSDILNVSSVRSAGGSKPLPLNLPMLSPGDWMRRGLLAERLFHDDKALLAYRWVQWGLGGVHMKGR